MKRTLVALALTIVAMSGAAEAAPCGCKDLPTMVRELNEQEFLKNLFSQWAAYMPREILTTNDLVSRATREFNQTFYSGSGGAAAGTTHGGHAHMGTNFRDPTCPIVTYHYDRRGRPVRNRDGSHRTSPVDESTYKTKQCDAMVAYTFAHERHHQQTCLKLVAQGRTEMWDRPGFFAQNDADAYQAGIDVLRREIQALAGRCGWERSTKDQLPNVEQAQDLARRATQSRPPRRRQ